MEKPENKVKPIVNVFTGIRPTGDLTVANYLGAVGPILKLQSEGKKPVVFVADIHAMTDREPALARQFTNEVVADYLALGMDPEECQIYVQSAIGAQILTLTTYLSRLVSVAELLRIPTLKDKLKHNANPETANAMLLMYPVIMTADILLVKSEQVPVGEDQLPHLEMARLIARRFNKQYGDVFPIPAAHEVQALRLLSLKGDGKMSKTSPESAIFLTDSVEEAKKKIKRATTATEGEMSDALKSHIILAKGLAKKEEDIMKVDEIIQEHMSGKQVMGAFKELLGKIVGEFLLEFQEKKKQVVKDKNYVPSILERGNKFAQEIADRTMAEVERAMFGKK